MHGYLGYPFYICGEILTTNDNNICIYILSFPKDTGHCCVHYQKIANKNSAFFFSTGQVHALSGLLHSPQLTGPRYSFVNETNWDQVSCLRVQHAGIVGLKALNSQCWWSSDHESYAFQLVPFVVKSYASVSIMWMIPENFIICNLM